jgi:hypothetical protein
MRKLAIKLAKMLRITQAAWNSCQGAHKLGTNNTLSSTVGWLPEPVRWGYQRPIRVGIVERVAEYWVCQRCRWNQDIFRGKLVKPPNGGSGAYRIFKPLALLRLNPKFEGLRIAKWSRFGNSVIQLRNLLYIAELFEVRTLEFAEPHAFFAGAQIGAFELKWNVARPSTVGPSLEGLYFLLDAFQESVDEDSSARIFTKYLRPLLVPELRQPDPRVRREDLVLHFRAGDAFRKSRPHPSYGQPPLSYYLSAVEREQPQRVWLVFEDRANYCIDAAESALQARGLEVVVQSGTTLDDIRVLMTTERLVSSRGSFVHAIAHLSERLRKAYFFEGEEGPLSLPRGGVEVVVVRDIDGEFTAEVLSRNWTGSRDQRALLLSYPPEKLSFSLVR